MMILVRDVWFTILISTVAIVASASGSCSHEEYEACVANVRHLLPMTVWAIFPTLQPDYLDEHCSEMDDAFACMDDFHYHCNVNKQLEIDGMVSAYEYICRTGLDEYHDYSSCFARDALLAEGAHCNATYYERVNDITVDPDEPSKAARQKCKYMNDYLDCVENAANDECADSAAGVWIREFTSRLNQPLFEREQCVFKDNSFEFSERSSVVHYIRTDDHHDDDGEAAAVVAFLLIILLAFIVGTAIVCHMQQRQHKRALTRARMSAAARTTSASNSRVNENARVGASSHTARGVTSQTNGSVPQKSFSLGDDRYPHSSSYVRFDNDESEARMTSSAHTRDTHTASPDDVDITSGVGAYNMNVAREQQQALERHQAGSAQDDDADQAPTTNSYSTA